MAAEHLLSHEQRKRYTYAIDEWKRQLQQATIEHEMISKYKDRMWFQQMRMQSRDKLMDRYNLLASLIEWLEHDISDYQGKLGRDYEAREQLYYDRMALDKVDKGDLQQLELF